ncbi:MAG: phytanoyl-CoA dioxygenase family protein [Chitinophagales bacterium]|nr:phytanoyl-CoA dioxygenase family protein [Chitinophagales bacterium]
MKRILLDSSLDFEFHEKGFVKFPLFSQNQIQEIKEFYEKIKKDQCIEEGRAFHTTMNTSNDHLIKAVDEFIYPYFEKTLPRYLQNFNLTVGGFLAKDSGDHSAVTIHQDWTFVDETKYDSFNLWVALDDVGLFNGNMQVIPGSHKFANSLRISPDIPTYFHDYKDEAANYLVDVPVKAGECVMFYQSLIHASRKNLSKKQRVVSIISAYSKEADLLHFYRPEGQPLSKIEKYKISRASMLDLKKDQKPPHAEFVELVNYEPPRLSWKEFQAKCESNVPWWYVLRNNLVNKFLGKSS